MLRSRRAIGIALLEMKTTYGDRVQVSDLRVWYALLCSNLVWWAQPTLEAGTSICKDEMAGTTFTVSDPPGGIAKIVPSYHINQFAEPQLLKILQVTCIFAAARSRRR